MWKCLHHFQVHPSPNPLEMLWAHPDTNLFASHPLPYAYCGSSHLRTPQAVRRCFNGRRNHDEYISGVFQGHAAAIARS